jgi:hypothetical protein
VRLSVAHVAIDETVGRAYGLFLDGVALPAR